MRPYDVAVIVWLNGAFGMGKTTTAAELLSLLPDARQFDPETDNRRRVLAAKTDRTGGYSRSRRGAWRWTAQAASAAAMRIHMGTTAR
jgi:adenylylsulfate kinase-like enzyme